MPATKEVWKSDSVDGALLFLCFHDNPHRIFHPDDFSASEIFNHPLLPFTGKYSNKNFRTYCQTAANRVKRFEKDGTGLSKQFKEYIEEARTTYSDILTQLQEDADYEQEEAEEEDDEELEADGDDDFADIDNTNIVNGTREKSMPPATKKVSESATTATKSATTKSNPSKNTVKDPYVVPYPKNNKAYVQLPVTGNVDVADDFEVVLFPRRIQGWSKVPSELTSAYNLLGGEGRLSQDKDECIHCTILEAEIERRVETMKASKSFKRDDKDAWWYLEYDLSLPFECRTAFFDKRGAEMNGPICKGNTKGFWWMKFWLKAIPHDDGSEPKRATGTRLNW
jgi:hypothetical protein